MNPTKHKYFDFIKAVEVFENLDDTFISMITSEVEEVDVQEGEYLFYKGDFGDSLFVVVSGILEAEDNKFILRSFLPGSVFGEFALLANHKRTTNIRAKEDSLLLKISDKFFYQFLLQDVHVLQNILRVLVNRILKEEQKNVELLQAILPKEIADELKLKGSSSPVHFECVSVVFTDFKGFTKIAEKMDPMELIKELDGCFSQFDLITGKYKLEKLKTIGDSYMFAGGIPIITPSKTPGAKSAIDSILASMEIIKFMERVKDVKMSLKEEFWELRLGIHSGPLVAGVIGEKKFAYDVWGDTVNTASRIESTGEVGKLNISGSTYNLIKDFFDCEYRGKIPAKNKGEIDMYFVTNIKPHLVRDNEIPNKEFWDMYDEL